MPGPKEYKIHLELTNFCHKHTVSDTVLPGKICGLSKLPSVLYNKNVQ